MALALVVAPYHLTFDGTAKIDATKAYARSGGNGDGNGGNGGGNAGGSSGGNAGGNRGGNAGGNSGGGNSGNNGKGKGSSGVKGADDGDTNASSHVNAATGDKVEIDGNKITVFHPNGMKEEIENGRFEMRDALDRTIVERAATAADRARLKGL